MLTLNCIAENLWTASQPQRFLGLEVGTRMTVIRLNHDDLVLISPIRLEESDRPILENIGTVRHIVAPNRFHHLYIASTQKLFPEAMTWGVEGLQNKCPDLKIDQQLDRAGQFGDELEYLPIQGYGTMIPWRIELANETIFLHRASRSLIITDIAFNFDENSDGVLQIGARLLGSYKVLKPSIFEKVGSRDKAKVEASIRQVLAWDFDRIVLAHGSIVDTDGKAKLRAGFEWFLGHDLSPTLVRI